MRKNNNGLTLVEVVVAVIAIGLTLTVAISYWNRKQQQEWQAIADAEPWRVFTIECHAEKDSFLPDEYVTLLCTVRNTTPFSLKFKTKAFSVHTSGKEGGSIPLWDALDSIDEKTLFSEYMGWDVTETRPPSIHELLPGEAAFYRLALVGGKTDGKTGKDEYSPLHENLTGSRDFSAFVGVADKDFYFIRPGGSLTSAPFEYNVAPAERRDSAGE